MLRNKRGFVIEGAMVVWVVASLVVGAVMFFQGPAIIKAVRGGDVNKQKAEHKLDTTRTYYQKDACGNITPAFTDTSSEYSNELVSIKPPETLWEKFWHMGIMAVVIIIIITVVMMTPIGKLLWNIYVRPQFVKLQVALQAKQAALENVQVEQEEFRGDAKLIVQSVDEGLATMDANIQAAQTLAASTLDPAVKATYNTIAASLQDMKADFVAALSKRQDSTTKLLVRELKND